MHNNRIKGKWLVVLAVLLPWMAWAQVPPPVVRNVLDTNLVAFGASGQALFRTAASPYLNWSNVTQQAIDTNAFQPASTTLSNLSGTGAITNAPWTNSYQPGSSILTNLSGTGALTNFAPITVPTRLVFEGDSTSLLGAPSYPYWLTQVYGLTNGLWCWGTNAASNTATLTNIISEYVGQIQPWKPSGGTNAILFLWAGINDLAAGASSNDVVRDVSNYCATARADGFKVCLLTIGRSAGVADAGRVGANEALRFGGFADWVVDAGRMFPPPSATASVTNYYIDVTHLNTNAQRLLAAAVRDTLFSDDQRGVRYDPWADGNVDALAAISLRPGSMLSIGNFISGTKSLEVYGQPAYFQPSLHSDSTISGFLQSIWYNGINASGGSNLMAGDLGLGTNIPQSRLHVTADNSVPYVAQFGTTNRPQLSLWDTNGNQTLTGWLSQTSGTNYGDAAKTNWTTTTPAGFLDTNTAGGYVSAANGTEIVSGALAVGTNNASVVGKLSVFGADAVLFQVGSRVLPDNTGGTNVFLVKSNSDVYMAGSLLFPDDNTQSVGGSSTSFRPSMVYAKNDIQCGRDVIGATSFVLASSSAGSVMYRRNKGFLTISCYTGYTNLFGLVLGTNNFGTNSPMLAPVITGWTNRYGETATVPELEIVGNATNRSAPCNLNIPNGGLVRSSLLKVQPLPGGGTNFFEVLDTNGIPAFVVDSNNFVGIGTNLPAAPLHIVSTNVSGKLLVVQSNTSGTATFIITNGVVGIGKNNPSSVYALDVTGLANVSSSISSGGNITGGAGNVLSWNGRSRMLSSADGYIQFLSSATDFTGLIFGTNSIAAPASGPTNAAPMLKKARQFSAPTTHVPGFKLTDQSDGTNGCFLELKSVSSANTNKLVPESASVIHFATTNGTPDGKAEAWITEESGRMFRVRTLGGIFGQLCTAGTNAVWLPAAATYTNVFSSATNNVVAISTNEFYGAPTVAGTQPGNTPALTNIIAGWYKINIHASFLGQSSGAYEFEVFTNSVACEACAVPHNCDNPARTTSCSASHICYLPAECRVDLRVKGGATETIGLNRASLMITIP